MSKLFIFISPPSVIGVIKASEIIFSKKQRVLFEFTTIQYFKPQGEENLPFVSNLKCLL
ncbi:MAG: hypothetical protein PWP68_559 [Rikenellaceae bacterium]|nr:hypothetical protein [Rikenellaceae bacterium]